MKNSPPPPEPPLVWPRSDPAELAKFDPASKECTMNCGKHGQDPRSYKELKFQCDDCLEVTTPTTTERHL